ncbi:MAG: hypothetical protein R2932_18745 [Caldilineaceae bacterium]
MTTLSPQAWIQAQQYVNTQGRAVDQARLSYYFGEGTTAAVPAALAVYQECEDGGFGHALEPDLRFPCLIGDCHPDGLYHIA